MEKHFASISGLQLIEVVEQGSHGVRASYQWRDVAAGVDLDETGLERVIRPSQRRNTIGTVSAEHDYVNTASSIVRSWAMSSGSPVALMLGEAARQVTGSEGGSFNTHKSS
jgi:hypothetical protein